MSILGAQLRKIADTNSLYVTMRKLKMAEATPDTLALYAAHNAHLMGELNDWARDSVDEAIKGKKLPAPRHLSADDPMSALFYEVPFSESNTFGSMSLTNINNAIVDMPGITKGRQELHHWLVSNSLELLAQRTTIGDLWIVIQETRDD